MIKVVSNVKVDITCGINNVMKFQLSIKIAKIMS